MGVALKMLNVPTTQGIVHVPAKVICPEKRDDSLIVSSGMTLTGTLAVVIPALMMMF